MEKTKFKKVTIYVADNGYTMSFSEHVGSYGEAYNVAKDLQEVKTILGKNLLGLKV